MSPLLECTHGHLGVVYIYKRDFAPTNGMIWRKLLVQYEKSGAQSFFSFFRYLELRTPFFSWTIFHWKAKQLFWKTNVRVSHDILGILFCGISEHSSNTTIKTNYRDVKFVFTSSSHAHVHSINDSTVRTGNTVKIRECSPNWKWRRIQSGFHPHVEHLTLRWMQILLLFFMTPRKRRRSCQFSCINCPA